jgi:prevent-host-death family protein
MANYGILETKNNLSKLLQNMAQGENVTITKHGRAVARLTPIEEKDEGREKRVLAAVERIKMMRVGQSLGGLNIKDLIVEGRR